MPGGLRVDVLLTGEDTGGAFCLLADHPPAGWALPAHLHEREAETVYVLDGRFELEVDGVRHALGQGEVLHIAAGATHSSRLLGDAPGRRLLLFSPAGMERFFREAGRAAPDDPVDLAEVVRLAQAHGWRFASL